MTSNFIVIRKCRINHANLHHVEMIHIARALTIIYDDIKSSDVVKLRLFRSLFQPTDTIFF